MEDQKNTVLAIVSKCCWTPLGEGTTVSPSVAKAHLDGSYYLLHSGATR